MKITSAKYLTSVTQKQNLLTDGVSEFAFVGRSNVGKSSIINNLVGIRGLAKASSTPGLTKMINYFEINGGQFRFVDLPGYGFHKAGKTNERMWVELIEEYLFHSEQLKTVFMLVDCRIVPTEDDLVMRDFLMQTGRNFMIIATKCDKLSKQKQTLAKKQIADRLKVRQEAIVMHSSQTSQGKDQILTYIENCL